MIGVGGLQSIFIGLSFIDSKVTLFDCSTVVPEVIEWFHWCYLGIFCSILFHGVNVLTKNIIDYLFLRASCVSLNVL